MTRPDSIEARVARGAALLDENVPGWWRRIDVGTLDLAACEACVLGQVYEAEAAIVGHWETGFGVGVTALGLPEDDAAAHRDHGFDALGYDSFAALADAWIATIKDRWERLA